MLEGIDRRGRPSCAVVIASGLDETRSVHGAARNAVPGHHRGAAHREDYTRYLGRVMGDALNEIYFLDPETLRFHAGQRRRAGLSWAIASQQL
jgi:two-component system CheB/CheR fusion protein